MNIFKSHILLITIALLTSCATIPTSPQTKVLIIDGYSNHDWTHTTRCIKAILDKTNAYNITVSTFPADGNATTISRWVPDFKAYDVVIQNSNIKKPWPRQVEKCLEEYVHDGGGLFIFDNKESSAG